MLPGAVAMARARVPERTSRIRGRPVRGMFGTTRSGLPVSECASRRLRTESASGQRSLEGRAKETARFVTAHG